MLLKAINKSTTDRNINIPDFFWFSLLNKSIFLDKYIPKREDRVKTKKYIMGIILLKITLLII